MAELSTGYKQGVDKCGQTVFIKFFTQIYRGFGIMGAGGFL